MKRPLSDYFPAMGGCKWCAQGDCWSHGGATKPRAGGRNVIKTFVKRGGGKGAGCKWCERGQCWSHGGRKGGGKSSGGGKGGGQWVFVSGSASSSFGKGNGRGKGNDSKFMDKLGKIEADRKVWVGGLAKGVTWKELEKHFEESGATKPKVTEIMSKGKGCCAFKTAEEAQAAIAAVNGSELDGEVLEVDVWTQKEKKEREDRPKRKFGSAFVKTKGENLNPIDASLKVWVGGLSEKTTAIQLKKHFVSNGCAADKSKLMKKGTACVTFKTEAEATSAIAAINTTELDGSSIEVDVWTKSEKKVKVE